jgi:hypothetical protein
MAMPRYFFHVEDGALVKDEQGTDLPNLEAAQKHASILLGELLTNCPGIVLSDQVLRVNVTDDCRMIFLTVEALATVSHPLPCKRQV